MRPLAEAVAAGDLDELIRVVDGLSSSREWSDLIELRDRCRHAHEQRGLQLWPAAEYAEYRMALEAPGEIAAAVVETGAGRFALGPLWEVAASTHEWADLRENLPVGPERSLCAHERVLRGERLQGDDSIDPHVLELPLELQGWEPDYQVAVYRSDEADFDAPTLPELGEQQITEAAAIDDDMSIDALLDIGSVWARQSNGKAAAATVRGTGPSAIAVLGHGRCRLAEAEPGTAVAVLSWAAASGGAYGRRRGSPVGRFSAWWLIAALADLEWPPEADDVGAAAADLRWWVWEPLDAPVGWNASIAVEAPDEGLAWALEAWDRHREGDEG